MAIYTTIDYYNETYLLGRAAVIDATLFNYYAMLASKFIKQATFGNIDETKDIIDEVQMCCCEIAEQIFINGTESADKGNMVSEKVGDYSVSYESSKDKSKEENCKINGIIHSWLGNTGLLYCGVM